MKLAAYLVEEGLTNAAFARMAELSEGTVSLLCRDEIWLSRATAEKILKASNGKVTPNDFMLTEAAE
jgi:plasmid maintenance system antidote protein VapI